eukprot:g2680.t1
MSACPVKHDEVAGGDESKCPVKNGGGTSAGWSFWGRAASASPAAATSTGDVAASSSSSSSSSSSTTTPSSRAGAVEITAGGAAVAVDPSNNMPLVPEQGGLAAQHGGAVKLGTARVSSTIPKGSFTPSHQPGGTQQPRGIAGADAAGGAGAGGGGLGAAGLPAEAASTAAAATSSGAGGSAADASDDGEPVWQYPSEQMFFNAMKRKGWDPQAEDMGTVVSIHNAVNERAWRQLMEWEKLHCDTCPDPKLLRFMGRPKDLSPKARFLGLLGYNQPFDRHDWVVDRCGEEVRYVIDFYNGRPTREKPIAVHLDVRPALDSVQAALDRIRRLAD